MVPVRTADFFPSDGLAGWRSPDFCGFQTSADREVDGERDSEGDKGDSEDDTKVDTCLRQNVSFYVHPGPIKTA